MEAALAILLILAVLSIILLIYFLYRCSTSKKRNTDVSTFAYPHVPYDTTQLVVWKKPGVLPDKFNAYIAAQFPKATVADIKYCGDCDNSLVVISNIDVNLFLAGNTPTSDPKDPKTKPVGDVVPAYFSPNFPMEFKDVIDRSQRKNNCHETISVQCEPSFRYDAITVAVFDTGVDATKIGQQLYKNNTSSCLGTGADNGWNFADHTSDWNDDFSSHHGSIVAKFIVDQAYQYYNNNIKILPVKVFNKDGACLLSDVLCALQYAKNRGADIINASFGFYAPIAYNNNDLTNAGTLLFKSFLEEYFKKTNILMIAAAGNKDDDSESYVYKSNDETAKRNLDNVSFYPASFATTIPNIFAITTASNQTNEVSPHQNFSEHVIDVGVNTDSIDGESYQFYHPFESNSMVEGSSFATPIAAGKIASNFYLIKDLLTIPVLKKTKEEILERLAENGLIYTDDKLPANLIKKRRMMDKW